VLVDSSAVPRFLERSSVGNRLVGMLVLAVLIPGMVLAWYAIQSVLQQEELYRSELDQRAHQLANEIRADIEARHLNVRAQMAAEVEAQGEAWLKEPDKAASRLLDQDNSILGVFVFDSEGILLSPTSESSWGDGAILSLLPMSFSWSGSTGTAQVHLRLDPLLYGHILEEALELARRMHPEYTFAAVEEESHASLSEPIKITRNLAPWLPQTNLVVTPSYEFLRTDRQQGRLLRLLLIGLLSIVILIGIALISRVVSKEVEVARLKSDFLSSVSHELRTPLTTIRIMAEMLSMGAVASDEKRAEYHKNIVSESDRLTRLINNVLDFARIEDGRKKFEFGFGDIADTLFEVERITGDYARKEGFTLNMTVDETLPPVSFDRDAMIQALINLVSNAVKYSRDEKYIELGASAGGEEVTIWVKDHGPGIEASEIPHLFERFYRGGDHMTREAGGTGLGLSIVQHIISAHGGRVRVESKVGHGSRFEIILPLDGPEDGTVAESRI
jgi:signal transduction histidine kinase